MGNSLLGKANPTEAAFTCFSSWTLKEVDEMYNRYKHDLGGLFALNNKQFEVLIGLRKVIYIEEDIVSQHRKAKRMFKYFDTDNNRLVDAYEVMCGITLLSTISNRQKMDFFHSLYDFNETGDLTIDEIIIMFRTVVYGANKIDNQVEACGTEVFEKIAENLFESIGRERGAEISKFELDKCIAETPLFHEFLEYWAGALSEVRLGEGQLFCDPAFPVGYNTPSLYIRYDHVPKGLPPADQVLWLRPNEYLSKLFFDIQNSDKSGNSNGDDKGMKKGEIMEACLFHESGSLEVANRSLAQGGLSNRWFVNALSLLMCREEKLQKLFLPTRQEDAGRFCVQFFKEGNWTPVYVDDRIPCDLFSKPYFTTGNHEEEVWMMLVEKAYAKLHGCYERLQSPHEFTAQGRPVLEVAAEEKASEEIFMSGMKDSENTIIERGAGKVYIHEPRGLLYALRDLTGGTVEKINLQSTETKVKVEDGIIWNQLQDVFKSRGLIGFMLSAVDKPTPFRKGVVQGDLYGVVDMKERRGLKLIKIRNLRASFAQAHNVTLDEYTGNLKIDKNAEIARNTTNADDNIVFNNDVETKDNTELMMNDMMGKQDDESSALSSTASQTSDPVKARIKTLLARGKLQSNWSKSSPMWKAFMEVKAELDVDNDNEFYYTWIEYKELLDLFDTVVLVNIMEAPSWRMARRAGTWINKFETLKLSTKKAVEDYKRAKEEEEKALEAAESKDKDEDEDQEGEAAPQIKKAILEEPTPEGIAKKLKGFNCGGSFKHESWVTNTQFFVRIPETSELVITLTQEDSVYHHKNVNYNSLGSNFDKDGKNSLKVGMDSRSIGLVLYEFDWDEAAVNGNKCEANVTKIQAHKIKAITENFGKTRDIVLKTIVPAGKYIIIPQLLDPLPMMEEQKIPVLVKYWLNVNYTCSSLTFITGPTIVDAEAIVSMTTASMVDLDGLSLKEDPLSIGGIEGEAEETAHAGLQRTQKIVNNLYDQVALLQQKKVFLEHIAN